MSKALYRRYRPETFQQVIGQSHVTEPLMAALRSDRTTHAYLFSGPRGCGKTTSARILARCLNCAQGPTDTPCGECESCVELARDGGGSLDVVELDAASHGGVDDARELRERAAFAPARDRYKIFIIDEAHMVTNQGFNALLKLVEEPPAHVKFIFATTEPEKVIGTIRSRTHHYPFRLVPPDELETYLARLCAQENIAVAPGVLPLVVRAGTGSVRDTLSVLDQLIGGSEGGRVEYERAVALLGYTDEHLLDATVEALSTADGAALFSTVEQVVHSGHDPRRFVEDLLQRFRDLLVIALAGERANDVLASLPDDQVSRMREQVRGISARTLTYMAKVANDTLSTMAGATAPRLQLELLAARLIVEATAGAGAEAAGGAGGAGAGGYASGAAGGAGGAAGAAGPQGSAPAGGYAAAFRAQRARQDNGDAGQMAAPNMAVPGAPANVAAPSAAAPHAPAPHMPAPHMPPTQAPRMPMMPPNAQPMPAMPTPMSGMPGAMPVPPVAAPAPTPEPAAQKPAPEPAPVPERVSAPEPAPAPAQQSAPAPQPAAEPQPAPRAASESAPQGAPAPAVINWDETVSRMRGSTAALVRGNAQLGRCDSEVVELIVPNEGIKANLSNQRHFNEIRTVVSQRLGHPVEVVITVNGASREPRRGSQPHAGDTQDVPSDRGPHPRGWSEPPLPEPPIPDDDDEPWPDFEPLTPAAPAPVAEPQPAPESQPASEPEPVAEPQPVAEPEPAPAEEPSGMEPPAEEPAEKPAEATTDAPFFAVDLPTQLPATPPTFAAPVPPPHEIPREAPREIPKNMPPGLARDLHREVPRSAPSQAEEAPAPASSSSPAEHTMPAEPPREAESQPVAEAEEYSDDDPLIENSSQYGVELLLEEFDGQIINEIPAQS